jgi:lipopolysaccharide transport system permease protein
MSVQLQDKRPPVQTPSTPTATKFTPDNRKGMLDLWSMRHLIAVMVKRDLLGQYKGSMMGFFWTIINPLGHLLLYTFVFSIILKVRFSVDGSTTNFAMYLMAGLIPWTALAESLNRSTSSVVENPNLVKRVVFPLEILPLATVVSSLISGLVGTVLLVSVSSFFIHTVHATVLFIPVILLSQFLFIAGLSWMLGSLGVYLQDLKHVMSLALSTWMYATPIVYPATSFPKSLHLLLWLNPMAGIVTDYRRVILEGLQPDWTMYASYTAIGLTTWFVGYFFFCKTKRSFADVV